MDIKDIKKEVENYFNIDLINKNRKLEYLFPRYVYFYLCYKYGDGYVVPQTIADSVNIKQHGTVLNGLEQLESILNTSKSYRIHFNNIELIVKDKSKVKTDFIVKIDSLDKLKKRVYISNLKYKYNNKILENKRLKEKLKLLLNEN